MTIIYLKAHFAMSLMIAGIFVLLKILLFGLLVIQFLLWIIFFNNQLLANVLLLFSSKLSRISFVLVLAILLTYFVVKWYLLVLDLFDLPRRYQLSAIQFAAKVIPCNYDLMLVLCLGHLIDLYYIYACNFRIQRHFFCKILLSGFSFYLLKWIFHTFANILYVFESSLFYVLEHFSR